MAKAKLTTRAISATTVTSDNLAKASQLTHNQLDSNFINLRDATFGVVADDSATIQVGMDSNLYIQGGTNITTATDSAGVVTITGAGTATSLTTDGLTIEDNDIKGTRTNENIVIDPAGTGTIELNANTNITGTATVSGAITGSSIKVGSRSDSATDGNTDDPTAGLFIGDPYVGIGDSTQFVSGVTDVPWMQQMGEDGLAHNYQAMDANVIHNQVDNGHTYITTTGNGNVIIPRLLVGNGGGNGWGLIINSLGDGYQCTLGTAGGAGAGDGSMQATVYGDYLYASKRIATTSKVFPDSAGEYSDHGLYIEQNNIYSYASNDDVKIWANGTGSVVINSVSIRDNTITTNESNANLELSANSSGIVHVNDSLKIGTGATVTTILDEDAMGTDSATALATQQSIKAYVDAEVSGSVTQGFRVFGDDSAGVDIAGGGSLYLQGGDNVTTTTNSDGTLTINAAAESQSVFKTISVSGQDDVVADTTTDTLTLAAGSNMTITTTAGSDTITFASSGSADIGDITFTGSTISSPSNADITLEPSGTGAIVMPGITINDNNITGTRSNEDIRITASGSGDVIIDTDTIWVGSGSETARILSNGDNDLVLVGGDTDEVKLTLTGSDSAAGAKAVISNVQYNIIGTGSSQAKLTSRGDQPLRLMTDSGNGTAKLSIINDSGAEVTGTLSATGTLSTDSALVVTGASTLGGISVEDHTIKTNSSNANMFIEASGTGTIQLENLKIGTSGATVTTILDEDAMGTNSATALATQQSIKAYVDSQSHGGGSADIGDITFTGSTISSPSNADLTLLTSGSGDIILNEITIHDNTITTNSSNATLYIDNSGTGDVQIEAGDDIKLVPADDVAILPGDDLHIATTDSGGDVRFWTDNGSKFAFHGNYAAVWDIIRYDDAVHTWNETGTNDYPDTGDDLWKINLYGGTGSGHGDNGQGGALLFEAGADWSGSSRSTTFEIQLCQTGSTSLTTPFKINATGNVDLTGSLTAGTSIENDAIRITDNTILGLRSNDNITITPAGTGSVAIAKAAITGGTVTGITDLVVADGGTGAGTFTDGGILLGSGTNAITAMAALGDSEMIVGNGSTDPVAESGATLRTSIGVGTGDSPQFTGLTISGSSALDGVTVTDNTISSNASNANLEINANGSGTVVLENLSVAGDGATVTGILDEDAMGSDSAVKLATQQSIKAYVDANVGSAVLTGTTNNTITTVTGANAIQGEANATFDGSTLAITGNITATTTIAATTDITAGGDISSEGIQLVDNKISASRTNDTLFLAPAGTGLVNIGNSDFAADVGGLSYGGYGGGYERGVVLTYADLTHTPGSTREYAHWINGSWKTDGADTTSSNARYRALIVEAAVDLNGSSITHSSSSRGAQGANMESLINNTSADLGTMSSATGFIGYVYVSPSTGSVAMTNIIGCSSSADLYAGGLGGSNSITVTNAYGFKCSGNGIGGTSGSVTATITNSYNFFSDSTGSAGITNEWHFYDTTSAGTNSQSRLGAIQLINQSSAPTNLANHSWIYALDDSASSEVYVRDEAGNATKISPHNEKGEWEFYSKNTVTGKTFRVNMEKMIKKIEELTGESFIETI